MRSYLKIIGIIIATIVYFGCSAKPTPIHYGMDNCSYCEMTIVDNKYSAELVTDKGKIFKFDAIECMIRHIQTDPDQLYKYLLVADLNNPGDLINAEDAFYLISAKLPSPMGENLSGFSTEIDINYYRNNYDGIIYSWKEIISYISEK